MAFGGGGRMMGGGGPKKPLNKATPKRVAVLFRAYGSQLGVIALAVFASAGLGLLPPYYLRVIIDKGLTGRDLNAIAHFSILTLLATVGSTAFALGYGYLSVLVGQRIMRDLRQNLFAHLQGMSLRFFTSTRTGEIQSRLISDVGGVQGVLSDTVANVLSNVATVLSTLVAMFLLDYRLTLLAIGLLPFFAFLASRIGVYAGNIRKVSAEQNADLSATMQETLSVSGVLLTKTSGRQQLTFGKFQKENDALTGTNVKMAMVMRYFFNLIGLTFSLTPVGVYWLAGYLIVGRGETGLTLGSIVAFTALQGRLFFPLTSLLNVQVEVGSALALFDRIFEYMDLKQDIVDAPDAQTLLPQNVRGAVTMENVFFSYEAASPVSPVTPPPAPPRSREGSSETSKLPPLPSRNGTETPPAVTRLPSPLRGGAGGGVTGETPPTLSDISFNALPGQLVALVGPSGAGKTTLTYLIPRLYDPDEGRVLLDGIDVKNIKLESMGQIVGVVTQETYLVHDTIRENLRYGRPDATDEELIEAARSAAIHDHIAGLPDGYDTVVGERGYKLSGGEKQRIAIARAILKNPRILVLDEATSALDTQSERLIQDALARLSVGRTTFAIAHRLSTILAADLILVLQAGRIVERGTHPELLAQNGLYARLYEAQFQEQPADGTETYEPDVLSTLAVATAAQPVRA